MSKWDEFINNEKFLSTKFFENFQISNECFNEENYKFLKPIFKKCDLIEKIYTTVDDLIGDKKSIHL